MMEEQQTRDQGQAADGEGGGFVPPAADKSPGSQGRRSVRRFGGPLAEDGDNPQEPSQGYQAPYQRGGRGPLMDEAQQTRTIDPDVARYEAYDDRYGTSPLLGGGAGGGAAGGKGQGTGTQGMGEGQEQWEEEGSRGGLLLFAIIAAIIVAGLFLGVRWFASDDTSQAAPPAQGPDAPVAGDALGEGAAQPQQSGGRVADTGVVFEPIEEETALRAGPYEWDGDFTVDDMGTEDEQDDTETLILDGPTFANLKTGFKTGDAEVTSGNFGFATLNYRVHGEYHRTVVGAEGSEEEIVYGSYFAFDDERLLASGQFQDARTGDGDEVIRTYEETPYDEGGAGETKPFKVKFEAAPLTPAVLLVGSRWEAPQGG